MRPTPISVGLVVALFLFGCGRAASGGASSLDEPLDAGTELHKAVANANPHEVAELLRRGADPNGRDARGRTPLHLAVNRYAHARDLTAALLDAGADANARDAKGRTPLHRARTEAVSILLNHGANVGARDHEGRTPLFTCGSWDERAMALLMARSVPVNVADVTGRTPLHEAAAAGNASVVSLLIVNGADPATRDKAGKTPRDAAADGGQWAVADMLGNATRGG